MSAPRPAGLVAERVKVAFLGGLGEIGRNCAVFEQAGRLVVLDCGVLFPNPEMPGVDLVLPDLGWLAERRRDVDGIVLTHGHEDHVGALAYLLRDVQAPVYGSAFTLGIARNRLEEANLAKSAKLIPVRDGERRKIGPFDVEFIPVTHSVPNGFAVAFHTAQGVVLHSGDFKLDLTPVDGRRTDLARIGQIASSEGIRLLLSDSTNAEEPGFTGSERSVGESLRGIFSANRDRRIIVACFASHVHRIQQLANAAIASGRRIALLGRSMVKNVALARELGLLVIPDQSMVEIEKIDDVEPGRLCIISTGSQGEPMSALSLMAAGESRFLSVVDGDVVVLSSHAIPGNEWAVAKVMDGLARRGADVIHAGTAHVHESGHRARESWQRSSRLPGPAPSSRCTANTATSCGTPASPSRWASRRARFSSARTATGSPSTTTESTSTARCRPLTSSWTASPATWAWACCGTVACSPRRESSSPSSLWTGRPGRWSVNLRS